MKTATFNIFRDIAVLLSQIHPLLWLITYIIAIPLYALVYQFICGNGFYEPNLIMEKRYLDQKHSFEIEINDALNEYMFRFGQREIACTGDKRPLFVTAVFADKIDLRADTYRITIVCFPELSPVHGTLPYGQIVPSRNYEFPIKVNVLKDFRGKHVLIDLRTVSAVSDAENLLFSRVFPSRVFPISFSVFKHGYNLRYIEQGYYTKTNGYYFEMLYFSVVVISTLGLGDITPISDLARLCVGTEVIFGLLMFGLFLNSLAYQASGKVKTRSDRLNEG